MSQNVACVEQDIICIWANLTWEQLYIKTFYYIVHSDWTVVFSLPGFGSSISPYIKHYEGLSYDREALHRIHLRARRATTSQEYTLKLDFTAFHRWISTSVHRHARAHAHILHCSFSLFLFLHIYTCIYQHLFLFLRNFRLHLKHDSEAFLDNFTVITETGSISADLSHMYSGILEGGYHVVSIPPK